MDVDIKELKKKLKKYNQEHLLLKYDEMNDADKQRLLNEINNIDFDLMEKLYKQATSPIEQSEETIEPIEHIEKAKLTAAERLNYEKKGIEAIKYNKFAVVTMAGGQGTRLGHTGPKGTYNLGLPGNKSLFELICETFKKAWRDYDTVIPWYIMTSRQNNDETVDFFEKNNYFGYPKDAIHFFMQGELPMIGTNGKILLDEKGFVKLAANGHGGTLQSMFDCGIIEDMEVDGIEWVFISGVDNVLVKPIDPILIGLSIDKKVLGSVKSIEKTDPKEKVGVFCKKNKKVGVVEYTEISDEMANLRDDYGSLVYGDANAIFHLYNIKGLAKVCNMKLPYHIAFKKATYMDENGKIVVGKKPNAYKFETFIFDSYEMLDDVAVLRVKREEEFAPLKNAEGPDSPETARKLYTDYNNKVERMRKYNDWCTNPVFDEATRAELQSIRGDEEEIKDRFYKELEFGTAGMRGIIGNGINRMNVYTVTKATQGLANYIARQGMQENGVVIAYDSRNMSFEFARATALCLNANGIKTYIYNSLRSVPQLSFSVRQLKAVAGVMITASHNPAEYNGYKVYWSDGAQITSPVDKEIIAEVNKVKDYSLIRKISLEEAKKQRLYIEVGSALDKLYFEELEKLSINKDIIKKHKDLKIVYTPLHGTGNIPVQTILNKLGFEHVYVVPAQELPNGDFPTVELPNPEDPKAFAMALDLAKEKDADIVLATDPDADRLGVYAKDSTTGEYKSFTGNMSGLLIAEYILSQMKANKTLPKNGALVTTIVSSNLAQAISKEYGIEFIETLTGFKYIGEKIRQFESSGSNTFLFGFEESYGCLVGTHARDKDAIVAVMMLCEAAAYYKDKGLTLWDQMIKIYEKYGFYKETIATFTLKGADGAARIQEIMNNVRNIMPTKIGDHSVLQFRDYKLDKTIDIKSKKEGKTGLPNSNVLYFDLDNNAWCCIRPSGTEPKIKLYMGVKGKSIKDSEERLNKLRKAMIKLIED